MRKIMNKVFNDKNKLVLGTAQLGLNYGINNTTGQATPEVAKQVLESCMQHGVNFIDTASVYGNSEEVIGNFFAETGSTNIQVITKINIDVYISNQSSETNIYDAVDFQINKSIRNLKTSTLFTVLLHRASNLTDYNGAIWSRLLKLKHDGLIEKLGVSIQTPDELDNVLTYNEVEFIQLPFNILDERWRQSIELINNVKLERNITIHVRSVFLQGLLLSDNKNHWLRANCKNSELIINWLHAVKSQIKRESLADLCIAYVRSLSWVDGLVMGMESIEQLNDNITIFQGSVLTQKEIFMIENTRPKLTQETLNPAKWNV
jgi:aryl-alcohol dehydrogenase-like predicted oxidoreductase